VTAAETLAPLVSSTLGDQVPIRIRCWDGSEFGPADAPVSIHVVRRRALRRIMWQPNELGFARAYVSGDLVIDGDLWAGLTMLDEVADPTAGPGVQVDRNTLRALARVVIRLRLVGAPPRPPAEESRLSGRKHTTRRDAAAISHHYDVGNDFYRVLLGPTMTYSCAYWPSGTASLEAAQEAKCALVARKLGLRAGMRVLDVGCGWGTFAIHAAQQHGASVVGVTLSEQQALAARRRVAEAGVGDLVEIRVQDYRDVADGPYDAIASIGMAEHVGVDALPGYATALFGLLRPEGRLLNHAISRRPGPRPKPSRTSFIDRYVFPDGELVPLAKMIDTIEDVGFEVRDVQSLREHYTLTLRAWLANLEADWDRAVELSSPARARIWRLYIAGSALAFQANRIGVNQVLAVKPGRRGRSDMPMTRAV
jgi:cyclopropane-fatty-acyl-phospholipid synthase